VFFAPRPRSSDSTETRSASTRSHPVPDRTRKRRSQRGAGPEATAALTQSVSSIHLRRLQSRGIEPIVVSRWLNAVSAVLSPDERSALSSAPYVDRIRRIRQLAPARPAMPASPRTPARSSPLVTPPGDARPSSDADSSYFGSSYNQLRHINALAPLRRGIDGRGVRLGFLDTGYRGLQHPAFDALRREGRLRGLRDFTERPQTNNHGGGVVSAAAGYAPGVLVGPAHGAEIWAAATEYTATETNVEEDHFVAGLEWLERQGVDVVNVSLGYTTFDDGERSYTVDDLDGDTGVTTQAVDAAARLGVTVVVSAGNSGCNSPENCWYYVSTPADADSAITVGAVLPDSSLAPFSSRGPTADGRTKPDVAAVGDGVVAAWETSSYAQVNGTSFASPLVSGIVAQMLQQNPRLRPMEIRRILRQTASQASAPDDRMGWGVVNADAAVRAAERRARSEPPSALSVSGPAPNPASQRVSFTLRAPKSADSVHIALFDVLGQRVRTVERSIEPGPNTVQLPVGTLAPGVYPYRLRSGSTVATGKVVVVR
jgi:subtilisin family serine protease